jgi:hypothetical protein
MRISKALPRNKGKEMTSIQFMNQDGEWESYPDVDVIQHYKTIRDTVKASGITTRCCLCNKEFDVSEIVITGGSLKAGFTWSCPDCHAVTLETNVPK